MMTFSCLLRPRHHLLIYSKYPYIRYRVARYSYTKTKRASTCYLSIFLAIYVRPCPRIMGRGNYTVCREVSYGITNAPPRWDSKQDFELTIGFFNNLPDLHSVSWRSSQEHTPYPALLRATAGNKLRCTPSRTWEPLTDGIHLLSTA